MPISELAEAFNQLIQTIVEERAPFVSEGCFIKHYNCANLSYVRINGQIHIVYDRNALFNPRILQEGDLVKVDTRYATIYEK